MGFPDYAVSFCFSVHPTTQMVRKKKELKDILKLIVIVIVILI